MLNEARFNFTRYGYNGITSNPQVNFAIPRIEVQGMRLPEGQRIRNGASQGDTSPGILAQNTYAFRDVLAKVMGNKALKFGFEFSREQDNDALIGGARPDQVFDGFWNFANGTPIFEAIEVKSTHRRRTHHTGTVLPFVHLRSVRAERLESPAQPDPQHRFAMGVLCSADRG
jgi:hypothetical protein